MRAGEELKARVLAGVASSPRPPTRAQIRIRGFFIGAFVVSALVGMYFGLGGIHWDGRPAAYLWGVTVGWALICASALFIAFGSRQMAGRPGWLLWAAAGLSPLFLFGWAVAFNFLYPETFEHCGRVGFRCLDLTLASASLPVLALGFLRRSSDPLHPAAAGAAIASAVGSCAALVMSLGCECTHPSHVALGHVLPVVLLALFGAYVGWRWMGPRRR